jgi:ankyrin repeat domain-containing protein 50
LEFIILVLWVSGDPGCGKSVLSFLVDELKGTASQLILPATVCFFFCDDKIESQKDGKSVFSGLLHQKETEAEFAGR